MRRPALVVLSAFALGLASCSLGGDFAEIGTAAGELRPADPFARLVAHVGAGSLTVTEGDGSAVRVEVVVLERSGRSAASPQATAATALPFADWVGLTQHGDTIEVRPLREDADHQFRVAVTVPKGKRAFELRCAAGAIDCTLAAATTLDWGIDAGGATVRVGAVDRAIGRGASGEARVAIGQTCGNLDVELAAGSVRCELPASVSGRFDLAVSVGGLNGAAKYGLVEQHEMAGATATGRRGDGDGTYRVHVGAGQIDLR